jgi:hypothetical protein
MVPGTRPGTSPRPQGSPSHECAPHRIDERLDDGETESRTLLGAAVRSLELDEPVEDAVPVFFGDPRPVVGNHQRDTARLPHHRDVDISARLRT